MKPKFFVLSPPESLWHSRLQATIDGLGQIESVSSDTLLASVASQTSGTVVVIDTSIINNVPTLVKTLIQHNATISIIVLDDVSPKWEYAREIFRAGALDVIPTNISNVELEVIFDSVVAQMSP